MRQTVQAISEAARKVVASLAIADENLTGEQILDAYLDALVQDHTTLDLWNMAIENLIHWPELRKKWAGMSREEVLREIMSKEQGGGE